jgi:lipid-binding SYLF domain-containing protein
MPPATFAFLLTLLTGLQGPVDAPRAREDALVADATASLREIQAVPDRGIPTSLLREARGLVIVPSMKKVGFVVTGQIGRGLALVRREDGSWSPPIFIRVVGLGFGAQAGVEAKDLILICRTERSMRWLTSGAEITLGADIGAAAGPVGRELKAATNLQLNAEMLSYSRSRGLFAGVAVSGGKLRVDGQAVADYYRLPGLSVADLVKGTNVPVPASAVRLAQELARATNGPPVEVVPPPGDGR